MISTFLSQAHWLQIFVATLIYFILGAVWYSPVLFATPWMTALGKKKEEMQGGGSKMIFVYTFVYELIICILIGGFAHLLNSNTFGSGLELGLIFGIGFCLLTAAINNLFAQRPSAILWIDAGYHTVGITIASVLISVWS